MATSISRAFSIIRKRDPCLRRKGDENRTFWILYACLKWVHRTQTQGRFQKVPHPLKQRRSCRRVTDTLIDRRNSPRLHRSLQAKNGVAIATVSTQRVGLSPRLVSSSRRRCRQERAQLPFSQLAFCSRVAITFSASSHRRITVHVNRRKSCR